jgi:uncharacterized membrane protein YgcG
MNLRDDLKAYLDGELAPERMAEMREAIDRDPALAQEAEELGRISQTLRAAAAQPASAGLEATLRALEKAERRERKPWWPWLVPVAGMTAFLVFAVAPTMQQAKMAAKSDISVASRRQVPSEAVAAEAVEELNKDAVASSVASVAKEGAKPVEDPRGRASTYALKSGDEGSLRGKALGERQATKERPGLFKDTPKPATRPASPKFQNARRGAIEGNAPNLSSDYSNVQNFAVGPKESKEENPNGMSTLEIRAVPSKVAVETIVIEVDSVEGADDAARELMARLGAEDAPVLARKAEKESTTAFDASIRDQAKVERRVVLEVDEDQLGETKKRVTDTVKESQARREVQPSKMRGGGGGFGGGGGNRSAGGGFAGGGSAQSQQSETNSQQAGRQQQNPSGPSQRTGAQSVSGQGGQGIQGRASAPRANVQKADPQVKSGGDMARNKQVAPKPRKRIEIILRVKPKPAGKLEE